MKPANMTGDTVQDVIKLMKVPKGEPVDMDKAHDPDAPSTKNENYAFPGPTVPKDDMAMLRDIVKVKKKQSLKLKAIMQMSPMKISKIYRHMTKDIAGVFISSWS